MSQSRWEDWSLCPVWRTPLLGLNATLETPSAGPGSCICLRVSPGDWSRPDNYQGVSIWLDSKIIFHTSQVSTCSKCWDRRPPCGRNPFSVTTPYFSSLLLPLAFCWIEDHSLWLANLGHLEWKRLSNRIVYGRNNTSFYGFSLYFENKYNK